MTCEFSHCTVVRQLATPTVWCVQNWLYADTLLSNREHLYNDYIPYPLLALPPHDVTEHCVHAICNQCSLLHSYRTTDTLSTDVHTQQILPDHTSWMTGPTYI